MKRLLPVIIFQLHLIIANGQSGDNTRYYVDQNAAGSQENGLNWIDAFHDLQDAIAVTQYGDTIWVAQGIYHPTDDDDRTQSFELRNGVTILGGFNGTEWYEWQRNPELYETVLSGEIGDPADSTDNSMHVVYTLGTDENTALDGFTITRGFAYQTPGEPYINAFNIGAGLFVDVNADYPYARPRIRRCKFVLNTARLGGGIYCYGVGGNRWADPVLEDCVFDRNYAVTYGGAIYKEGESPLGNGFILHRCRFDNNTGLNTGGAIMLKDPSRYIELRNCSFEGNKSMDSGGAIYYESYFGEGFFLADSCIFQHNQGGGGGAFAFASSQLGSGEPEGFTFYFSNSQFDQNRTPNDSGGAIAIGNLGTDCQVYIIDCTFSGNWSLNGGSGIYFKNRPKAEGKLYVQDSKFIGNEAPYLGRFGGIYIVGHLVSTHTMTSRLEVYNTIFARNDGAIAVDGWEGSAESLIQNCTFYENGKYPISKNWDPLFDYEDYYNRMEITNSIIWEPSQPLGRILYNGNPTNFTLYDYRFRNCLISADDCNLPGGATACETGNIFDTYPVFVDTLMDDFRLAACSPAINAGSNAHLDSLGIYYDLAGVPRIQEGLADIGAYERPHFQLLNSEVYPADCADEPGGSVVVTTNGDDPLSYTWLNEQGQSGTGNEQLLPDMYQITVTDFPGCSDTLAVQIDSPAPLTAAYEAVNASSFESADGSIAISQIEGGTPPYGVVWSTGDVGAIIDSLGVGDYQAFITDSLGCVLELDITISADVSVGQLKEKSPIRLYPNPVGAQASCKLEWDTAVLGPNLWCTLTDTWGRRCGYFGWSGGEAVFPTAGLAEGVYFMQFSGAGKQTRGLRLVINK
jgi:predicted outer membrane repeat protein